MSKVIFTGRFGLRQGKNNEYVKGKFPENVSAKARELLAKGVKIDVKKSAKTVQPLLTELLSFPLPEEEDEPKTITRYGLKIKGGRKAFDTNDAAVHWHKRYYAWRGVALDIKEVEVKA